MILDAAPLTSTEIDPGYVPRSEAELVQCLKSPTWRLYSGQLYKIMVKGDDDDPADTQYILPFKPNGPQRELFSSIHNRNVILKARQLGFTTAIQLFMLDHALFNADQRCGTIAHSVEDVKAIFRDKIQFAYEHLPPLVQKASPIKVQTKTEYLFEHNNSGIRVAMSMRSGTIHRLHVSEMGKMAAKFPGKAEEVVTGSLPAVPKSGIAFIESTAEGQSGSFYDIATAAEKLGKLRKPSQLAPTDWRFFFFAWWMEPNYQMDPTWVPISDQLHDYFDKIELEMDTLLTNRQRAWYAAKLSSEMGGDHSRMWREYPSKPEECWQQSSEGKYYPEELAMARVQNRVRRIHYVPEAPVHTFWDIGNSDGTGIWLMQIVHGAHRFLEYIEEWGKSYSYYITELQKRPYLYGKHFVPHDAGHARQGQNDVTTGVDMLEALAPSWEFEIVPRTPTLDIGIALTRKAFPLAEFNVSDVEGEHDCRAGLVRLSNYQKSWSTTAGAWTDQPLKNDATEAADAFRQWAQALEGGQLGDVGPRTSRNRRPGALAV